MSLRSVFRRMGGLRFLLKAMAGLVPICHGMNALAADADEGSDPKSAVPNIYLDVRTYYTRVPAGSLTFGFGRPSIFTALPSLTGSTASSVTLPASQTLAADLPFTVDVSDSVSLYGGVSGSSTQVTGSDWSSLAVTSWNIGFQAELYQQNGGMLPTVTWQSTIAQSVPNGAFAATSFNNIVELGFAFDEDETRGLLAGIQHVRVDVGGGGGAPVWINPTTIGYFGGYYQWPNNWKVTGRLGIQVFQGAQLLNFAPIQPFTQPVIRLDLDRMDDNDNRLFGVTAELMWLPKPAFQFTVRTPLYFTRN